MKYYRVVWDDNSGYVYVSEFSRLGTAFRFMDYVDSLGWCAGAFFTIEI